MSLQLHDVLLRMKSIHQPRDSLAGISDRHDRKGQQSIHQRCLIMQADKAHVCVRLLSLSDAMGPSSEQVVTQEELTHAATALSKAAPLPGPLADLRLQNGDMDALRMLWAQV